MSVNYQTDPYLLCHGNLQTNQVQQQELLIVTLKQLAEENKRLLKERENFEEERLQRKIEMKIMKQNFINLLTLAQYESNQTKFGFEDSVVRLTFNEKISKKSYLNFQNLKDFNFFQKVRYSTLMQMIKSNFKSKFYANKLESGFDCRPYKGPKTPPTPNSKFQSSNPFFKSNNSIMQDWRHSQWSIEDMLFYLKRYKEEFRIYSGTMDNCPTYDKSNTKTFGNLGINLFSKAKVQNNNVTLQDDSEFYKELIERHKKSLEMIDSVSNKLLPNPCSIMMTNNVSDMKVNNENDALLRNQVYCDYSQYLMKNPITINGETLDRINAHISNSFNELRILTTTAAAVTTDGNLSEADKFILNNNGCNELSNDKNKTDLISQVTDINQSNTMPPSIDLVNAFEEGEIVDSADESKNPQKERKSVKDKAKPKKETKRNTIAYTIDRTKLKSLATKSLKKPLVYSKATNYYSRLKILNKGSGNHESNNDVISKNDNRPSMRYRGSYSSHHSTYERRQGVYSRNVHDDRRYNNESKYRYQDRYYYDSRHRSYNT